MLFRKKEINLDEKTLILNNTNDISMYLREMYDKINKENIEETIKVKIALCKNEDDEINKLIAINESEHINYMEDIKSINIEFKFHMGSNMVDITVSRGLSESKNWFILKSLFKSNQICRKDLNLLCICSDYIINELNEKLIDIVSKQKTNKKDVLNILARRKYNKV